MEAMALTVPEVVQTTRIGRNEVYRAIASGELRAVKVGSRRLIVPVVNIADWLRRRSEKPASD